MSVAHQSRGRGRRSRRPTRGRRGGGRCQVSPRPWRRSCQPRRRRTSCRCRALRRSSRCHPSRGWCRCPRSRRADWRWRCRSAGSAPFVPNGAAQGKTAACASARAAEVVARAGTARWSVTTAKFGAEVGSTRIVADVPLARAVGLHLEDLVPARSRGDGRGSSCRPGRTPVPSPRTGGSSRNAAPRCCPASSCRCRTHRSRQPRRMRGHPIAKG